MKNFNKLDERGRAKLYSKFIKTFVSVKAFANYYNMQLPKAIMLLDRCQEAYESLGYAALNEENYYQSELQRVTARMVEFPNTPVTVQVTCSGTSTKCLTLNKQSIAEVRDFLNDLETKLN